MNVGPRQGVCRDFAVLGYCERGLECERQHVRECPDFAEKGTCGTKGCKLPHVIRANRNRKVAAPGPASGEDKMVDDSDAAVTAEDAQLGDEYISLTFKESDSSESEGSEEEAESDEDDDEEDYEMEVTM